MGLDFEQRILRSSLLLLYGNNVTFFRFINGLTVWRQISLFFNVVNNALYTISLSQHLAFSPEEGEPSELFHTPIGKRWLTYRVIPTSPGKNYVRIGMTALVEVDVANGWREALAETPIFRWLTPLGWGNMDTTRPHASRSTKFSPV